MDHDERLADLEARVRRLEERPAVRPVDAQPAPADPFWVLDGLRRSAPSPAVVYAGIVETPDGPVEWQMEHPSAGLLEQDWAVLAPALSALGHPTRLQILQLVARGEASTAADLAGAPGLGTTGQVYHHLRLLVSAGWLRSTTRGHHAVPPERLVPLLVVLSAAQ